MDLGVKDWNNLLCLAKRADIAQLLLTDGAGGLGLRARLVLFLSKLNGSRAPMSHRRVTRPSVGKRWWSGLHLHMAGQCSGDPLFALASSTLPMDLTASLYICPSSPTAA